MGGRVCAARAPSPHYSGIVTRLGTFASKTVFRTPKNAAPAYRPRNAARSHLGCARCRWPPPRFSCIRGGVLHRFSPRTCRVGFLIPELSGLAGRSGGTPDKKPDSDAEGDGAAPLIAFDPRRLRWDFHDRAGNRAHLRFVIPYLILIDHAQVRLGSRLTSTAVRYPRLTGRRPGFIG